MKGTKMQLKRNKSQNKNNFNKNIKTNKSLSLINKNNQKKNKSKNKVSNSKVNLIMKKSKPKKIQDLQNVFSEPNYNINNINDDYNNNFNNYNENINFDDNQLYNQNINNYNNSNIKTSIDNSIFKNTNYNSKNFSNETSNKSYINNDYIENSNIFKKTLDRLLITSKNLIDKQNDILLECDTLCKNVAMNDYSIQNISKKDDNKLNFQNIINNYTNNMSSLLSQFKKNKTDFQINEKLKKENDLLKNKLQVINIDNEENINLKNNEISTLKIVLVSEINHILNFLNEIGYDNIPVNKMEISDITSQKISDFFNLVIKIIKQMKELIHKKESIISKMTIDLNTLKDNKSKSNIENMNNNNKSFEKLSFDYNKYNLGLKNYNISVSNISNQKKKINMSYRSNLNTNNNIIIKNESDNIPKIYNVTKLKKNLLDDNRNKIDSKDKKFEIISNKQGREYNNIINKYEDNYELNKENIKDNKMNTDSYFYNNIKQDNNYSIDAMSDRNYKTGSFIFQVNSNNHKNEENINEDL